jgi:hypothetical protein
MAGRLNLLFQTAPRQFMERTVLFVDSLTSDESMAQTRDRISQFIDLEAREVHARARILRGMHEYQDTPLVSYFLRPRMSLLIPREDPPHKFVFLPEFSRCRLLVSANGPDWLKLELEDNLAGRVPRPDSKYLDSFAYWDHTYGDLVGVIRGTAILVKQPGEPWTVIMQQIVGTAGHEVVRQLFTHALSL